MNKRNPRCSMSIVSISIPRADADRGESRQLTGWVTDHTGCIRLALVTDGVSASILHRPDENAPFTTVVTTNFKEQIQPLFFDFDNELLSPPPTSTATRRRSCVSTRQPQEESVIFQHPEVDGRVLPGHANARSAPRCSS